MQAIDLKPTAKLAVKKSILRVYEVDNLSTVYLKDGSEFEIELFNPTQEVILCKFKFNGKSLNGEGLILYPGQRVFLERYLDNNKKFKFETYKVEDSPEVEYAIIKNGLLEVEFFNETYFNNYAYGTITTYTNFPYTTPTISPNIFYTSGTITENSSTYIGNLTNTSGSCNTSIGTTALRSKELSSEKETGVIDKGEQSNQAFKYENKSFSYYAFQTTKIKILPESEKIYDDKDLKHRKYCSECGKKINHKDKFCSFCGAKL